MARRRKEGLFEDLIKLPWPAGVIVGLFGFFVLSGTMFKPFAWVVLLVGLAAAALSALGAAQRSALLEKQTGLDSLRALSWKQFERLVGEAYRRQGYRIEETGQGGADGGIDLLLSKDGVTTLVQCKQWRNQKIGVAVVREMYGLMVHHDAYAVYIVCTGVFSSECEAFARGKPVELVDGAALLRLVQSVQINGLEAPPELAAAMPPPIQQRTCPQCGAGMVERSNRNNGQRFWGCSGFPKCRGTIPIPPA